MIFSGIRSEIMLFLGTKLLLQITLPSIDSLEACQILDNLSLTDATPTLIDALVKKASPPPPHRYLV